MPQMPIHSRTLAAIALCAAWPAQALVAGDLMFTSFNADADRWTVVALAELAPHTTVFFSDNAWDGAAGLFVGSESHHRWDSGPGLITAGTVVRFSHTDSATLLAASSGSLSRARVAGSSTYDLSQSAETLYAYAGSGATMPSVFITALSTGGFAPAVGGLAGTGLVAGVNAVQLAMGSDFADYAGSRSGSAALQFQALTAAPGSWTDLGDGLHTAQAARLSTFEVTAVPEPSTVGLALAGLGVLGAWRWRR